MSCVARIASMRACNSARMASGVSGWAGLDVDGSCRWHILSCKKWVVALDSVDGGKCRFDAHRAHCGVQPGIPQQLSTMWKGTFSARQGRVVGEVRAVKANYTIARQACVEGNSLRHTGQNVEVDLDRAGIVMPSPPVCSTPRL